MLKHSVEWNKKLWNEEAFIPEQGEGWSNQWGNSEYQWYITILPRIKKFLPSHTILEIAPGWGRWTRFLLNNCNTYYGIDISEDAIKTCQQRFYFNKNANFILNDGKILKNIKENSIDFIFSMDSLVHVGLDGMESYIKECARVLSSNGYAFIHHSNMNKHINEPNPNGRAPNVDYEIIKQLIQQNNCYTHTQETLTWLQNITNDCFTIFGKQHKQYKFWENTFFNFEIQNSLNISTNY